MVTTDDYAPDEVEDRDLELEEDDDQGEDAHDVLIEDLPPELQAEILEQLEQVKLETETYPEEAN